MEKTVILCIVTSFALKAVSTSVCLRIQSVVSNLSAQSSRRREAKKDHEVLIA